MRIPVPTYDLLSGVAYDMIPPPKDCGDFDVMYFGTLALRNGDNLSTVRRLLERCDGKTIFVDMNIRPPFYTNETVRFALSNADVVKLSDEELPTVFETVFGRECPAAEDAAARLADGFGGCKLMIVTRGGDGAFAYDCRSKEFYRCGAVKAEVVSTVGAGDSFGAVFLHSYLSDAVLPTALPPLQSPPQGSLPAPKLCRNKQNIPKAADSDFTEPTAWFYSLPLSSGRCHAEALAVDKAIHCNLGGRAADIHFAARDGDIAV